MDIHPCSTTTFSSIHTSDSGGVSSNSDIRWVDSITYYGIFVSNSSGYVYISLAYYPHK